MDSIAERLRVCLEILFDGDLYKHLASTELYEVKISLRFGN